MCCLPVKYLVEMQQNFELPQVVLEIQHTSVSSMMIHRILLRVFGYLFMLLPFRDQHDYGKNFIPMIADRRI